MTTSTLRPGLLVAVKTSITGNVSYLKTEIEGASIDETGVLTSRWETAKTVKDAAEHEAAGKVRSKARNLIGSVCSATAFGYLCPESAQDELNKAIADARALCDEFNKTATMSRVWFNVISGKVSENDAEAIKAINGEVRELLATMAEGVSKLDVKAVREAAGKAKQLGAMLSPEAQARITVAIEAVRSTARKIVAAGETAAVEIDRRTLQTIAEARTAFLDIDQVQGEIGSPAAQGRAMDLAPVTYDRDNATGDFANPANFVPARFIEVT